MYVFWLNLWACKLVKCELVLSILSSYELIIGIIGKSFINIACKDVSDTIQKYQNYIFGS